MRTPVLLSALLALVCVHVNDNVAPRSSEIRADLRHRFNSVSELTELLQPRQWIPISRQDKLYVGEIDESKINASLNHGVLTIMIPKENKPARHQIEIK